MACLETTFLIDLLRGDENIKHLKDDLDKTEDILAVAAPSVMELWTGAILSNKSASEKIKISELLSSFTIFHLDEKAAKEAGEIEADLIKKGQIIDAEDIMIAGIAKSNGEKLITRDQHYAKISGLNLIKY
ncbi:MAG: PIN domain-containing protein [Candidatus Aenigmatarchaeota archaeon]